FWGALPPTAPPFSAFAPFPTIPGVSTLCAARWRPLSRANAGNPGVYNAHRRPTSDAPVRNAHNERTRVARPTKVSRLEVLPEGKVGGAVAASPQLPTVGDK